MKIMDDLFDKIKDFLPISHLVYEKVVVSKSSESKNETSFNRIAMPEFNAKDILPLKFYKHAQRLLPIDDANH